MLQRARRTVWHARTATVPLAAYTTDAKLDMSTKSPTEHATVSYLTDLRVL